MYGCISNAHPVIIHPQSKNETLAENSEALWPLPNHIPLPSLSLRGTY